MPQPRSSGSGSSARSGSARRQSTRQSSTQRARSATARKNAGGSSGRSSGTRGGGRSSGTRSAGRSSSARGVGARASRGGARSRQTRPTSSSGDPRVEAAAQRLRRLNERIIDAGRQAGETTLSSYEKALKTIATTLERGPGRSDLDWVSSLANAQARVIRDVTQAWASAARDALK